MVYIFGVHTVCPKIVEPNLKLDLRKYCIENLVVMMHGQIIDMMNDSLIGEGSNLPLDGNEGHHISLLSKPYNKPILAPSLNL